MKNRIKKFGGIIAILLVTVACSNSSTSAVAPEKRESFAENIMVKLFKQYGVYSFEQPKEYFEKINLFAPLASTKISYSDEGHIY